MLHTDDVSQRVLLGMVLLTAALIGANFSILKFALDHSTPFLVAGMRTVLGGSFLIAVALLRGERPPTDLRVLRNIFAVGFSITTVSSALLVFGVDRVSAGLGLLVASTMPLFTAVLSFVMLRQKASPLGRAGLALGFVGAIVLAAPSLGGQSAAIGIITLALSALAWAFGTVYMKWQDFSAVSPIMLVGVQLLMSAAILIPFALIVEGTSGTEFTFDLFWPLLYAAIPANAITFSLIATIVKRASPTVAASTAYLIPVFGVFFGWLIRGDVLGGVEVLGRVLVVIGVYLVVTANARQASKPSPTPVRS